ncbi:MAG TPA: YoaK family protein [Mycobacterium sp.]|uniref:YoaK family protein n=1 Tax=Mycobacterium sp. TaxID=1785 RepID=UPI002D29A3A3|nr:YoaK family protein [Mycobacterium sp.]HZU49183.1 YoaK family protein [Mycobacterium sp.]
MTERTASGIGQVDSIDMTDAPQTNDRPRRVRPRRRRKAWARRFRLRRDVDAGKSRAALREIFDSEARLSWVLAWLAGVVGAVAFTHSAGYFVTTATGNTQRAVAGLFIDDPWLSISATLLVACFLSGVIVGSLGRRYIWRAHPHGPTLLTTLCLSIATIGDVMLQGWSKGPVAFLPILIIAFGIGALNTTFVKNGEVSVALSYVTGTIVKLGQGIERHISGGSAADWLGHFLLFASFVAGGLTGGCICSAVSGSQLLAAAAVVCAVTTGYTYFYSDRRGVMK